MGPLRIKLPRCPEPTALAGLAARAPGCVWLDSSLVHPEMGRYSFLGIDPFLVFQASPDGSCRLIEDGTVKDAPGDPWTILADLLRRFKTGPAPFPLANGGIMGYLGYDLGRYLERLPVLNQPGDLPLLYLGFFDLILAIDHYRGEACAISAGSPETDKEDRARTRLEYLLSLLEAAKDEPGWTGPEVGSAGLAADFTPESYQAAVERIKEYIAAGDVYQVNLSQRFRVELRHDPLALYVRLRKATPVPFGAFMRAGKEAILCLSPERFLRVRGTSVETRPIKGTRPRGGETEEDRRLAEELLASEKDRAELLMIVDLLRNDLARVCRPGTVMVPRLCGLESYANVHHLVATIAGGLRSGRGAVDLLRAVFPGGSVTGAPKIRAMEIIEELEPIRREVYTGSLGWLGFDGDADLNIAIRTAWTHRGRLFFQTGGAVTIDSDPRLEYEETLHKAAGFLKVLGIPPVYEKASCLRGFV